MAIWKKKVSKVKNKNGKISFYVWCNLFLTTAFSPFAANISDPTTIQFYKRMKTTLLLTAIMAAFTATQAWEDYECEAAIFSCLKWGQSTCDIRCRICNPKGVGRCIGNVSQNCYCSIPDEMYREIE
jgi:hypothetical protein